MKQLSILFSALVLTACVATSPEVRNEVLSSGYIYVSGKIVRSPKDFSPTKPVVVFLHGCAGFNGRQFRVMNMISLEKFNVVAPNSFARARNRVKCRGEAASMLYRNEDIDIAIDFIRGKTDKPIILVGFSEGGRAVAEYGSGSKIIGKVILGYDCNKGVNKNAPILNVVGAYDDEVNRRGNICNVKNNYFSESGHDVSEDKTVAPLMNKFMSGLLQTTS